jgi:TetR/AcrR family transcriptional regulator
MTEIKKNKHEINRERLEARILRSAEVVFAETGYYGSSMERIANLAKISKQNLIYYFPNKEILYRRVLQDILDLWIEKLTFLEHSEHSPEDAIRQYVKDKLALSREYPNSSKVFAHEIISGAPMLKEYLREHLKPQFERDVKIIKSWINKGLIKKVNPQHFLFTIWAATQTYADFSVQMEVILDKPVLQDKEFKQAEQAIIEFVMRAIGAEKK